MIIDSHVHIGRMLDFNMTSEQVLYSMARYGIDFSLVSNIEGAEYDHHGRKIPDTMQLPQDLVLQRTVDFARRYPDKIGALLWIKLSSFTPDDEFRSFIRDNRDVIYGLKFHPFHSRVAPDDDIAEPFYRIAEEFHLPIVSHTGGCEEARSIHLYRAALAHPTLDFVMVHMDLGTDNSEAIDLLTKLPNLYGDTTWVPLNSVIKAAKRRCSKKLIFGSDNPIDGKDTYLMNRTGDRSLYQDYFHELPSLIAEDDYDNIMYKNAMKLFRLPVK